ncbi:MAG: type III-B CRISPR module-associated protein Cmr3 [Sphingobacteriales bacterium]|jgi:CRISPR-associated protein Cmr3|nr:type III-B CRISPR module-associated protein Cmr3 [Sphingobacteriales bacterium]
MELRIEPLDTLFFRDGKPFSMGEETWADSHLLPSPSVIYGMLRTAIATQNGIGFETINNQHKQLGVETFRVNNIYYYTEENMLPMPLDLVEFNSDKEDNDKAMKCKVNALKLVPCTAIISKAKAPYITHFLQPDEQANSFDDALISTANLEEYLCGYLDETQVLRTSRYIKSEAKIGIARQDSTKTADEGHLFRTDMKRYHYLLKRTETQTEIKSLQIGVCLATTLPFSPLVRLGGEVKMVNLKVNPQNTPFKVDTQDVEFEGGRFKIYLSTPAIFTNGLPDIAGKLGINATLIAACVGKPFAIGGFDMATNQAKPMYKTVVAGSVYYYQSQDDLSLLHQKQGIALSDIYPEQGFGIAYFGTYQNEQ